jgi:hypothetical protein
LERPFEFIYQFPSHPGKILSHTLAWLIAILTILAVVTPTPLNNTIEARQSDVWVEYKLYGFVGCYKEEEIQIYAAFKEKDEIVGSDSVWSIKWNSPAAVDYFGYVAIQNRQLASIIC